MPEIQEAEATQSVHIAYDDISGGEPTVVLIHGGFCNRTYYTAQARHLAGRHRVLNIDLRGHGESDVPAAGYSLDALAADVVRVCDQAGVSRAVFCGHSMPVALKAANQRPQMAAGLVLLDGAVLLPDVVRAQMLGPLVRSLESEGWRQALQAFFGAVAGAAAERVRRDIAESPRQIAAPLLGEIVESDFGEELASVRCPVMYVHGEIPTDLERFGALCPDAMIESIPGAGHYVMLTAPDQVNDALDRFLEIVRSGADVDHADAAQARLAQAHPTAQTPEGGAR